MAFEGKTIGNGTRVLALTLAVLFVAFLSQVATHTHENGQDEATCQVCQAAHLGVAPTAGVELLSSPLVITGYVPPFAVTIQQELFFHDSPSRAPPFSI
jgi:Protein of unknown function (DUF2946)